MILNILNIFALWNQTCIGVAGSFSEGGQPFRPAKIQSFPANIFDFFADFVLPSYHAKLLCQNVLPMGKHGKWMVVKQWKTNQNWQKTDKNERKPWKMWSSTKYLLPSSHFCPAKHPFLSCQAPIYVLPSYLIFPGGANAPRPPPATPMQTLNLI